MDKEMTAEQYNQQHQEWLLDELLSNNKEKAKYIIENMPYVDVELDYDNSTTGVYRNDDYELEIDNYFLIFELNVTRYGYEISGDYNSPSEYVETSKDIYVDLKEVYEREGLIALDRTSIANIEKQIKDNVRF